MLLWCSLNLNTKTRPVSNAYSTRLLLGLRRPLCRPRFCSRLRCLSVGFFFIYFFFFCFSRGLEPPFGGRDFFSVTVSPWASTHVCEEIFFFFAPSPWTFPGDLNPGRDFGSLSKLKIFSPEKLTFQSPIEWNKLPLTLRLISSKETFKKDLKTFLFRKFYL